MKELLSRLQAVWDNMSPRERILIGAVGASLAATLLFYSLVSPLRAAADNAETRVDTAEQQLEAMMRLRHDYEEIHSRLQGVEQRIRDNKDHQNTLTLLESLAANAAVKIDSMEERKSPDHAEYRETRVEVSLKDVTLTQSVAFLHSIESSPRQFSVKLLRIKTHPDQKSDLLDVTFTVSTFEAI